MITIKGSRFNDTLSASRLRPSKVLGLGGNDILSSGSESYYNFENHRHILNGGMGNDSIQFNRFARRVYGASGNDYIYGTPGKDSIINGGPGKDRLDIYGTASGLRWRVDGGAGDDIISYSHSHGRTWGGIFGGAGNDTFEIYSPGLSSRVRFYGGLGNDHFKFIGTPETKITRIFGGPGRDMASFSSSGFLRITGNSNKSIATFQSYTLNGVGYVQKVIMRSIETVEIGDATFNL